MACPSKKSGTARQKSKNSKVKTKRKSTKDGKSSKSASGKVARARSAYNFFYAHRSTEVLRQNDSHNATPRASQWPQSQLLAKEWRELSCSEKQKYTQCAQIDSHRSRLQSLKPYKIHSNSDFASAACIVQETVTVCANAPLLARACGVLEDAVSALEELDRRMTARIRADIAAKLKPGLLSQNAAASMRTSIGATMSDRLFAVLQRWAKSRPKGTVSDSQKSSPSWGIGETPPRVETIDADTRSKAMGMIMRTFARAGCKAEVVRSRSIEKALYTAYGSQPREYKLRLRSITSNLCMADSSVLRQLLADQITAEELVNLGSEDLACESLKAKRLEERQKYYRCEVQLTAGLVKRRRELESETGRVAERIADTNLNNDDEDLQDAATQHDELSQEIRFVTECFDPNSHASPTAHDSISESESSSSSSEDSDSSGSDSEGSESKSSESD